MKPIVFRTPTHRLSRIRGQVLALLFIVLHIWSPTLQAELVSPAPDSAIWHSSATFTWRRQNSDIPVLMMIGTEPGTMDILRRGYVPSETDSITVHDIPLDRPIYLTVHELIPDGQGGYKAEVLEYRYRFNTHASIDDRDLDGIMDEVDFEPDSFNAPQTFMGEDYVLSILGSGRVASLQSTQMHQNSNDFFGYKLGRLKREQIQDITKIIYKHLDDVFDFVVLTTLDHNNSGGYAGIYVGAQNDTQGIGASLYDSSRAYGSIGQLQGIIHLPESLDMNSGPGIHELMHRWGSNIDILGEPGSHWGASDVGGQLGGWKPGSLQSLGNNQYSAASPVPNNDGKLPWFLNANFGNKVPLSDLELYLMGLISKDEIKRDFVKANNFQWIDQSKGVFQASGFTTIGMQDIISTYGERIPNHLHSQKQFNILYVVLSDRTLDVTEWKYIDQSVYQFSYQGPQKPADLYNFWEATGGRGSIVMDSAIEAIEDPAFTENVMVPLASIDGQVRNAHLSCSQINLANSLTVIASQPADLSCLINVAKEHIGKTGSTYVVAELVGQALFAMDSSGEYHAWDGTLETLTPSSVGVLKPVQELTAFNDLAFSSLGINSGAVKIYFGYAHDSIETLTFTSNGILILVEPEM